MYNPNKWNESLRGKDKVGDGCNLLNDFITYNYSIALPPSNAYKYDNHNI